MSTTANALYLPMGGHLVPLDLDEATQILPNFAANDRSKPESIQSDFTAEISLPGTAHNHRLLKHAAASQPKHGAGYVRLPCVLTSGGVETMPLGLLYLKGYQGGRYLVNLAGGNRRFIEQLKAADGSDKKLADLDLSRFDHYWTAANILAGLPLAYWQTHGWGYEVYDRGKPLDVQQLDPFTLYPSVAARLIWQAILDDAGFTADSLLGEPLFAALNVPTPNPYVFPQAFRDARALKAGYLYPYSTTGITYYHHTSAFAEEQLVFSYVARSPYHAPDATTAASYSNGRYVADTLGYYDIAASIPCGLEINSSSIGTIRVKFQLKVNGQVVYDATGSDGHDEKETDEPLLYTYTPKLSHYLLHPGDYIELFWNGDELKIPSGTHWRLGPYGNHVMLPGDLTLAAEVQLTVTLLEEFPQGGLVHLAQWLPDLTQLEFVKAMMLLLGLTIQADDYEPHLHLAPGNRLLSPANVAKAPDWTRKRDAYAPPGQLPERDLAFRFGSYGQTNNLVWTDDDHVTTGYGNGSITVADEVLPTTYELAKLPFAASQVSTETAGGLLALTNYEVQDFTASPITYSAVTTKPRLVMRGAGPDLSGQLILVPQVGKPGDTNYAPAQLAAFTTSLSYFASASLSLELNSTVLSVYWADLRAMLDKARYLTEQYRLTPRDIAELDFSIPIWDGLLGDYFAVSQVQEFDARRPTQVVLCRLNAAYLPPPNVPGGQLAEWYGGEFGGAGEWY